jgi:tRNA(fMet)-specific endonuclease VapC
VDIAVSTVVIGELFYGAERSQNPIKNRSKVKDFIRPYQKLSFSSKAARFFATIRFDLSKRGLPIGPYDLQIAAIALANNLTLVTHNTNEFSRVPGLAIEDWELPRNRLHK